MSQQRANEVRSVLIPLSDRQLLLPNAVVAEVMGYQPPVPVEDVPDWFLGHMVWRGIMIPVVSFEALLGKPAVTPGPRGRIAIMNSLNHHPRYSHFGVVVQAIPSLVRVSADNVSPVATPDDEAAEGVIRQAVELDMSPAYIPDLDGIEQRLNEVMETL